jgi:hypothetical protein
MLDHNSHSATVRGYAKSINMLFHLCNFPIPADFLDWNNICTILISGREKEENIARQRSPITRKMFAALKTLGNKSDINSPETVIADWFTFIRVTGLQVAEYAQQTKSKIDVHKYPSGKWVTKAFLPTDWIFYDKNNRIIRKHPSGGAITIQKKMKVTFRIQKNGQNGQSITIVSDDNHPNLCPVRAAYKIFLQARRMRNLWQCSLTSLVRKITSQETKYQMSCAQLLRQSIPICPKMKSNNSPHTQGEFGPLSCWTRPAWCQIS